MWCCNDVSSSFRLSKFATQSSSDCLFLHRIASSISVIICVTLRLTGALFFFSFSNTRKFSTVSVSSPSDVTYRYSPSDIINFLVKGLKGPERRRSLSLLAPILLNDTIRGSTIGVQRENKCKNSERHMERSLYNTNEIILTNVQLLLADLRQFHLYELFWVAFICPFLFKNFSTSI